MPRRNTDIYYSSEPSPYKLVLLRSQERRSSVTFAICLFPCYRQSQVETRVSTSKEETAIHHYCNCSGYYPGYSCFWMLEVSDFGRKIPFLVWGCTLEKLHYYCWWQSFLGFRSLTQEAIQLCFNNGWEFETLSSCKNLTSFFFPLPSFMEIQDLEQYEFSAIVVLSTFP